jgi:peptidyl-prolyl cis-trans isomerase D
MSMMWVKKQSKWAIVAAAVLIGGSLILMDLPSNQGMTSTTSVGEVDGEEISTGSFQQELQNYVMSEEARTGKQPDPAQTAQIRAGLFQFRVQNLLLARLQSTYGLKATVEEMQDWLIKNPQQIANTIAQYEGPDAVPFFLRDSTQNYMQFRSWLTQDSIYDRPGLRMLEVQLKTTQIPQLQLQQIFRSQVHRTDLEEAFLLETRDDRASLMYYRTNADDFPIAPESFDEAALKAHFEAHPDSFWSRDEAASLAYVALRLVPSAADTVLMRDFSAELLERLNNGEAFEDLARSYSNDPGSADQGGLLPPTARGEWVPSFADAAFSLAPGQVSSPVLTPFGYHIIKMQSKAMVGGVEKATVSHILLTITTGADTQDSVKTAAAALREQALKNGLEAAAKAAGIPYAKTPVFAKGTPAPLPGYVLGANSFAFSAMEKKAKVSEVLENESAVFILERAARYEQGRDFDRAREVVAKDLARVKRLEAARAEAERAHAEVVAAAKAGTTPPAAIGKAVLESVPALSGEAYAPGFGFGGSVLFKTIRQKVGEWGPVQTSSEGAVFALVTATEKIPPAERSSRIQAARAESDMFQTSNLYQQWAQDLTRSAKVVNRLDEVYRD